VGQAAGAGGGSGSAQEQAEAHTQQSGMDSEARSRVANMLRGGILYVKIRKGTENVLPSDDEDGVPRRATQARA
jgi:hypothetical protein